MTISVQCDDCGAEYKVKDELAGKKLRCKQCSSVMSVPQSDDDWDVDEYESDALPPPVIKKAKSKSRSSRSRSSEGMPVAIIVAIVCLVIMICFTLFNLLGVLLAPQIVRLNAAERVGAIGGDIVRALIQTVVLIGVARGSRGTRIPAMVLAVLFCLIIGGAGIAQAMTDPNGIFIAIALVFCVIIRLIFIACLAVSADHFED